MNTCDIWEELGQMRTEVKIALPMSDKTSTCLAILDNRRGVRTMKEYRLKVEIAQRTLSDLGCGDHTKA